MKKPISPFRLLFKTMILFMVFNLSFFWIDFSRMLGPVSAYNSIFPGRPRFPFGENARESFSLSLPNMEAMFASHEIRADSLENQYRILILGDSSIWGFLLRPEETLAALLEGKLEEHYPDLNPVVFNLGYPTISVAKDLLILEKARDFEPDLILWVTTLEAFPLEKQVSSPLVQANSERMSRLIRAFTLPMDPEHPDFFHPGLLDRSLLGQRRPILDWFRLQLYGIPWAATGIDQVYPETYEPTAVDLSPSVEYYNLASPLEESALAFDILRAGVQLIEPIPVILINEPIFVSDGENSHLRYNFTYPRWVYDEYRELMRAFSETEGLIFFDLWQAIDPEDFTNTPFHYTSTGSEVFATALLKELQGHIETSQP